MRPSPEKRRFQGLSTLATHQWRDAHVVALQLSPEGPSSRSMRYLDVEHGKSRIAGDVIGGARKADRLADRFVECRARKSRETPGRADNYRVLYGYLRAWECGVGFCPQMRLDECRERAQETDRSAPELSTVLYYRACPLNHSQ